MANLNLSVAVGDYDRNRPLINGAVRIDGVDPVFMTLSPEEIFFRAFRSADFDICELSLSSYTLKTALGDCPYVGIPAFVSKAERWQPNSPLRALVPVCRLAGGREITGGAYVRPVTSVALMFPGRQRPDR